MEFFRKIRSKLSKRSETLTKSKSSRKKLMLLQKKWKKLRLYGANYRPWSQILMRIEKPRLQSLRWRRLYNKPWILSKAIMMTKPKENGIWPKFITQPLNHSFSLEPLLRNWRCFHTHQNSPLNKSKKTERLPKSQSQDLFLPFKWSTFR